MVEGEPRQSTTIITPERTKKNVRLTAKNKRNLGKSYRSPKTRSKDQDAYLYGARLWDLNVTSWTKMNDGLCWMRIMIWEIYTTRDNGYKAILFNVSLTTKHIQTKKPVERNKLFHIFFRKGMANCKYEGHPTTYFSKSCRINLKQHYNNKEPQNIGFWMLIFLEKVFLFSKQLGCFSLSSQLGTEKEHLLRKLKYWI